MDLQTHLRATFRDVGVAEVAAALGQAPYHLTVRRAPQATDGRYAIVFSDDTPTGPDVPAWVRQCAGVVVDADDDHAVVAFCAPRSLEVAVPSPCAEDIEAVVRAELGAPEGKTWAPYVEGFRVLAYRWRGALRLSTSRVVDAYGARYFAGSPSFGAQFDAAAAASGLDVARLLDGRTYAFVVQSPDTPMVCPALAPALLHVATVDMATLAPMPDDDVGVPRPDWQPVASWAPLAARLATATVDPGFPGFLVAGPSLHAKVMHAGYPQARDLVGGDRDLARRMMEVCLDGTQRQTLLGAVPHLKPLLYAADARVHAAVCATLDAYVAFNVRHERRPLPQPVYETIKALHHKVYLARPAPRAPLAYGDVDAFVRTLPPAMVSGLCRATATAAAACV